MSPLRLRQQAREPVSPPAAGEPRPSSRDSSFANCSTRWPLPSAPSHARIATLRRSGTTSPLRTRSSDLCLATPTPRIPTKSVRPPTRARGLPTSARRCTTSRSCSTTSPHRCTTSRFGCPALAWESALAPSALFEQPHRTRFSRLLSASRAANPPADSDGCRGGGDGETERRRDEVFASNQWPVTSNQ